MHPSDTESSHDSRLITDRAQPPGWWVLLQLAALSFHLPLTVLSGGARTHVDFDSALAVGGVVLLVALLLYWILRRTSGSGWKSLAWSSVCVLVFWHWGASSGIGPIPGWLMSSLVLILALVWAGRNSRNRVLRLGLLVGAVAFSGTLTFLAVRDAVSDPDPVVGAQTPELAVSLVQKPDITLIVLDGYARSDVLENLYSYDNSDFLGGLEDQGFDVAHQAKANYTITHLSLPSMLNMTYMHADGASIGPSDLRFLADSLTGGNETVRILQEHGYTYIHGDTGHGHNRCGSQADVCLAGPRIDGTAFNLLTNTLVGPFLYPAAGDPSTALNIERIEQMRHWEALKAEASDGPVFSFLHLVLPHPPLFLDAACNTSVKPGLGGRILNDHIMSEERLQVRKDAWLDQVDCANRAINDYLNQAPNDEVIILVSDHGPDTIYKHGPSVDDYSQAALAERLPNLAAVRLPEQCRGSLPDDVDLVNVYRTVFSCLSDTDLEHLPGRYFAATFAGTIFEFKDPVG